MIIFKIISHDKKDQLGVKYRSINIYNTNSNLHAWRVNNIVVFQFRSYLILIYARFFSIFYNFSELFGWNVQGMILL